MKKNVLFLELKLSLKITLKTKIEQLKLVIKSHEDKIKSEANDDIRRLGICDIQKLYKQIEQTKDLLRRVEENEKRPKGFKAPLKDFLWEYNDGKFRTESELYFRSKQHIDYTEEKNIDFIDYNKMFKELKIDEGDFYDEGHLSLEGTEKVNKHFTNYIKEGK